ncbi:MAG: hypothetical protein QG611_1372 [Bacteroidota bacterium]|nr:hypothetical protein [Bacteroidota bacterium]
MEINANTGKKDRQQTLEELEKANETAADSIVKK